MTPPPDRRRHRHRHSRGQAVAELALLAPTLLLLFLGAADLARAFYLNIEIAGAARAGTRASLTDPNVDIGDFVRSEPNTAIKNDVATWSDTGIGGANARCTGTAQACGDPNGCPPGVFTNGRLACFAIRPCALSSGGDTGTCTSFGAWQTRPTSGTSKALQVRVVYRLGPYTPLIATFASANGIFYLSADATGPLLYF